jgi:hypothetical protein
MCRVNGDLLWEHKYTLRNDTGKLEKANHLNKDSIPQRSEMDNLQLGKGQRPGSCLGLGFWPITTSLFLIMAFFPPILLQSLPYFTRPIFWVPVHLKMHFILQLDWQFGRIQNSRSNHIEVKKIFLRISLHCSITCSLQYCWCSYFCCYSYNEGYLTC